MTRTLFALVLLTLVSASADAQLVLDRPTLTAEGVETLGAAAQAEAVANGWDVVVVVVDAGGHLLFLRRMDGAQLASVEIAQRKARSAALYRRPTQAFAERLASGNADVHQLPDAIPLSGGLPMVVRGEVIGAVGVSGVQGDQDAQIALAGITALLAKIDE